MVLHKCDFKGCDYKTNDLSHLTRHKKKHLSPNSKEGKISCKVEGCSSTFGRRDALNQHMKLKHSSSPAPEPRYRCEVCEKAFQYKSERDNHQLTHSDVRNFVCDVGNCGRAFKTDKQLKKHKQIHNYGKKINFHTFKSAFSKLWIKILLR